ncbi:hypothetical protein KIPB_011377, partial [Kipferlia bialata]
SFKGIVTLGVTILIFLDTIAMWHLFILGVLFGITDALYFPAHMAMVPAILSKKRQAGGEGDKEGEGEGEGEGERQTGGEGEGGKEGEGDYSVHLQSGNAALSVSQQVSLFLGPMLGGGVIALFPSDTVDPDTGEIVPTL